MRSTKNILLCAYACEPNKGSEPGVGWETSNHLAIQDSKTNYYVVTRKNNRQAIENESTPDNLNFIYYDLPGIFLFIKQKINSVRVYYYLWMFGATIKLWSRRNNFHIIHHITFVNDWFPSLFVFLKTKNNYFIWGPIGSNNPVKSKFLTSRKDRISEKLKSIFLYMFRTGDVFFGVCRRNADIIIGTNDNVKRNIKLKVQDLEKFHKMPAIAIRSSLLNYENEITRIEEKQFKILSAGQLRYIKNFRLTIKSFSIFLELIPFNKRDSIMLQIVGEGHQKDDLINYAKKLNVISNIEFVGQVKQSELMKCYKKSDVFLFPTLENAGFVILEAMSHCLPIIALDYGGPKQFIKEYIELQLVSEESNLFTIENELAQKILYFYENRSIVETVGKLNIETVRNNFTWEERTEKIIEIYKRFKK